MPNDAATLARLRAELEALRRSEQFHRSFVDAGPHGFYSMDAEGRFLTVTESVVSLLGYASAAELAAVDPAEVFENADRYRAFVGSCQEHGRAVAEHLTCRRKDGRRVTVRLSGRRDGGAPGAPGEIQVLIEDLNEAGTLGPRLQQAERMELLGQWTGGIAHDFNNLLTVILAHAEVLAAAMPADRPDLRADLEELRGAGRRGAAILGRLLGFARRRPLSLRPVNLADIVDMRAPAIGRLLPDTVTLEIVHEPDLPPIQVDTRIVEQILLNLAANARDAMPDGGCLRIETRRTLLDAAYRRTHGWGDPGEYVAVVVRDTGTGMDEVTKARIFEPFFTTKAAGMESGLGMAMVYGLMKQHRGFVEVESAVGRGTAVTVFFPVTVPEPASDVPPGIADQQQSSSQHGHETLLLVDDEGPIRRAAKRLFESHGYTIYDAQDGEEALQTIRAHARAIALVLADVMMPKMSGPDLYRALRQEGYEIPFLLMSGYLGREVRERSDALESVPFVQKPWIPADLLAHVRRILDRDPAPAAGRAP